MGGPRVGKSTVGERIAEDGRRYHHGEELKDRPEWAGLTKVEKWSKGSEIASGWFDEPGPWICENVATARALRKWLAAHPTGTPADLIVVLRMPVDQRVKGQEAMAVGVETVWQQVEPELRRRGVKILQARIPQ